MGQLKPSRKHFDLHRFPISPHLLRQIPPRIANEQVVEKRYERRQYKAKFDEKAEFMSINEYFEENFNAVVASAIVLQQPDIAERYFSCICSKLENLKTEDLKSRTLDTQRSTSNFKNGVAFAPVFNKIFKSIIRNVITR